MKFKEPFLLLDNMQILRCGPPPMNKAMAAHLDALEYSAEMQFQF